MNVWKIHNNIRFHVYMKFTCIYIKPLKMWIKYIFSPSNKWLKKKFKKKWTNLIDFRYQRHTLAVVGENLKCKKLSKRLQFLAVQTRCLSHAPNSATILFHILRVSVHRGRKLWVNTRAVTFFQINNGRTGAIQPALNR